MSQSRAVVAFFTLALTAVGCGEGPVSPAADAPSPIFGVVSGGPYVQMASGAGQVTLPFGQDQFALTAKQRADGSVHGRALYKSSFFDTTLRGNVVCMAWVQVGGTDVLAIGTDFPRPTEPDGAGPYGLSFVIDGGEGANASPDLLFADFPPAQA